MPNLAVFKMPVPMKITGRSSTITNAFVNSIIPVAPPTDSDIETALSILGMTHSTIECSYCGDTHSEWDHLRPLVKDKMPTGYISEIQNLVPSCGKCNQSKGNKDWQNWIVSDANKSPRSRGITDVDARIDRLNGYMSWLAPTTIDFKAVVGNELWQKHWDNCRGIHSQLVESQIISNQIKEKLSQATTNDTEGKISDPEEALLTNDMRIGELVRSYLSQIIELIKADRNDLLGKLQERDYSNQVFDLNYPFLLATTSDTAREARYWAQCYEINGGLYRVTSEWYDDRSRQKFLRFISRLELNY
jgi:hypothetical protein